MEFWTLIISLLALGFSVYTYKTHEEKIKKQEFKLNQYQLEKIELEEKESQKAKIEAKINKQLKGKRTITVLNTGKATAKNVDISFPQEDDFYITHNPCPIEIKPQHEIVISILVHSDSPDKTRITFKWRDEFQDKNIGSQVLQLY